MKIGIIGLDSSHAVEFTKILNDTKNPFHIKGANVTSVLPLSNPKIALSYQRIEEFTNEIRKFKNIHFKNYLQEVAEESDAILLTSVDAKNRMNVFREICKYEKPIFIDKPLALSEEEGKEIFLLGENFNTPIMSTSALRYDSVLTDLLNQYNNQLQGIYLHGPLPFEESLPGYYWYGIHMIEILITVFGTKIKNVSVERNDKCEIVVVQWQDGRFATVRGDRENYQKFGGLLHTIEETIPFDIGNGERPFYVSLLENITQFFHSRLSPIPKEETLAVLHVIDEVNKV
ncbi:gfo/Idh/MocA family oxidoreductase [Bacillus sp. REN16]|uniref:gfo/Idh/MocA family oxidoreductase n=1 Tax=Bacillus sp. REN16 TaxID=2887296 RepID=UPI001E35FF39|nr:gfo/Idh/MocA family oxidoreductase [Bacillus sp. REN16]MCC3357181.1 gfo/Idh/MocA family oxidoreductase [Bacillus sp. REN16]